MIFNTCSPSMADKMRYANGKHGPRRRRTRRARGERDEQEGVTRMADFARASSCHVNGHDAIPR